MNLDSAGSVEGIEVSSHSLESSRVCVGSFDTFHIFYYLAYGAPDYLKDKYQLRNFTFSVSLNNKISLS